LIGIANLPDVDFLAGYLVGDPGVYHWGPTHSIAAALLVGGIVAWRFAQRAGGFTPVFVLVTAAYLSHIVCDLLLGPGAGPAVGLQVFWPFSGERLMAPWALFRMAPPSIETAGPLHALFSREVLPMITREIVILGPVTLALWALRRFRSSTQTRTSFLERSRFDGPVL
jgi:membrane-bound metal-dependent hydrolase YbcI (DUF457 family)